MVLYLTCFVDMVKGRFGRHPKPNAVCWPLHGFLFTALSRVVTRVVTRFMEFMEFP